VLLIIVHQGCFRAFVMAIGSRNHRELQEDLGGIRSWPAFKIYLVRDRELGPGFRLLGAIQILGSGKGSIQVLMRAQVNSA
jgi:hypothetical protein